MGDKIPVMATWDDHDYGSNNVGDDYACPMESQDEFVTHFNIPVRLEDYSTPYDSTPL